jgi:hypothetical protein
MVLDILGGGGGILGFCVSDLTTMGYVQCWAPTTVVMKQTLFKMTENVVFIGQIDK